jgi:hypothetical protein
VLARLGLGHPGVLVTAVVAAVLVVLRLVRVVLAHRAIIPDRR